MAIEDPVAFQATRRKRLAEALQEFAARPSEQALALCPDGLLSRFAVQAGLKVKYLKPMVEGIDPIGRRTARSVEILLGKPPYWMDRE